MRASRPPAMLVANGICERDARITYNKGYDSSQQNKRITATGGDFANAGTGNRFPKRTDASARRA